MQSQNNIWQQAEAYLDGTMPETERKEVEVKLTVDAVFATEFNECLNTLRSLKGSGRQRQFRNMLRDIQTTHVSVKAEKETRTIPLRTYYLRTAAVAAGIAVLTSLTTFWTIQHNNRKIASQYSLLRRDLEKYKRSQNELIRDIKDQKTTPVAPARYTGTGFALTNDGYLVTNYHVAEGADSVYILNKEGKYFKASVVTFDQKTDVAILKIEDKNFHFGKGDLPYTFSGSRKGLGAKVYTLGYPDDNIVYNEGYISSRIGFEGDSMQYRLDIPANPGQSGAPVLDTKGNIIGIITGKESELQGATFAVNTKAILQLVHSLPKEESIHLAKSNKLNNLAQEQQIEKLQAYTFSVRVYK